jgi:transposase-like protein
MVCLASACNPDYSGFNIFKCFRCKKTYDIEQGDPVAEADRERAAKALSDEAIRVRIEENRLEDERNDKLAAHSLRNFFIPYYR